ncbi:hypothetical protein EBR96_08360, partial [bacterium]|nr:hypothetical protein [bacterium]
MPERAIADVFKNIDFESLRRPFFNALVAVNLDALWRYAASEYGKVLVSEFPAVWESMSHADELPNWVSHLTPQMWNDAETEFHLLHGAIDKGPDALWRIEFLRDHLSVFTLVRNLYPGEYIRTHPLWAAANVSVRGRGPVTVVRPRSPLDSALDLFGEIRARVWQTILKELNQFVASYSGSAVDEVVEKLDLWVRQMESDREVWNALANAVKARTLRNSVWLRLMASKEKWEQLRTVLSPQWLDPLFFEQVETSAVYSLCTTSARADQYWLSVFSQLECSDEFTQPCIGGQSPLSVYLAAGIETREDLGRRLVSGGTVKRLPVSTLAGYAAVAVCPDEKTWTYELVGKEDVGLIRMMLDLFPDSVYSGLEARQTPLHRCCELAQTIILGRTPQYQRLDRLSEIFDAIRERLCAGGRGTAQQFQLTPEALDLIQSVSDFLSEILAGMPTSIHSNFVSYIDNWKAALDRDRFRETFQFHIETDMTLSPPVLAGLLGDSFLSIHTQNICQDPKIYKTIFSKFLAFVDDQMRQNPSPLADFEFRSETLACVGFLLNQYEKSVDKIERLQLDSLFEVAAVWARESPKKLVVKLVSPSRSQSMRHK